MRGRPHPVRHLPPPLSTRPGLVVEAADAAGRTTLWTPGLSDPPSRYGERVRYREGMALRHWDPTRSKLAAALLRGVGDLPVKRGARLLYLGASAGMTVSHLADWIGPEGRVFAVERSPRMFPRLLSLARAYPNVYPLLADAQDPREYFGEVPEVGMIYQDVSQPDQGAIARENARLFLAAGGTYALVLKRASQYRRESEQDPSEALRPLRVERTIGLAPFYREHQLVVARLDVSA